MGFETLIGRIRGFLNYLLELVSCRIISLLKKPAQANDITAVVITCGETTYDQCLSSVNSQTVPVEVKTVRDVHPLSASLDAALDCCDTKWLLMVDADTLLKPHCIQIMSRYLKPGTGMVVANLYDKVYGVIGFLRLIDAETLKNHNFRHPENYPYPDRAARDFITQQGLKRVVLKSVVGTHNPYPTHFETFRRFYGTYRKRGISEQDMGAHVRFVLKYGCRTRAWTEVYYMMAGIVCGAMADDTKTRDYVDDAQMQDFFNAVASKDQNYGTTTKQFRK